MNRRFQLVDVFNDGAFSGNPLAVILDADGLEANEMQQITRWLNQSETAFLFPPTSAAADYRVRIFTHDREMPFAGHPTLGSCHAWLHTAGVELNRVFTPGNVIVQECGAGLVKIKRGESQLSFKAPALIRSGAVDERKIVDIARILQIDRSEILDAQWADNGPGWVVVLLATAEAVLALDPIKHASERLDLGVVGRYPSGAPSAFEIRAFFTDHYLNIKEDPVTGSLNASAAQWLLASGRAHAPYGVSQGLCLGRKGRIQITQDENSDVWVGGRTQTLFMGNFIC